MTTIERYRNERLDHLGIVAGVCQEIGLAAWLDAQDPGKGNLSQHQALSLIYRYLALSESWREANNKRRSKCPGCCCYY
jgi:hypothetical protein